VIDSVVDAAGQDVRVGDRIAHAAVVKSVVNFRIGTVTGFEALTQPFKEFRQTIHASPEDPAIKIRVHFDGETRPTIFQEWHKRYVKVG